MRKHSLITNLCEAQRRAVKTAMVQNLICYSNNVLVSWTSNYLGLYYKYDVTKQYISTQSSTN